MNDIKKDKLWPNKSNDYNLNRLWSIIEQSPNVIIFTDIDGNIEYVNDVFTDITGYTRKEVLGENPRILKSGEMDVKQYENLWKVITSGEIWRGEFHNKKKNGDYYWAQVSISPIREEYGKITGYLAIQEDITELKKAKERIENQEKFLRKIIDISPNAIFVKNIHGKYLLANKALGDIYNELPENIIGRTNKDFIKDNEEINKINEYDIEVIKELKEKFIPEESITDKMGNKRWFQTVKVPILSENGNCNKLLAVATDITIRKEIDNLKSDLINTVSHEIRTPLSSILGFTELLLERELISPRTEKYLNIINTESKRLTNLINDFLDVQRMESGKQVFNKTKINIVLVIEDIIELFSQNSEHKIVFNKKNSNIDVWAEGEKIVQLVSNLLSNAIKYSSSKEKIVIDLEVVNNNVLVSITDRGIGIPEGAIPKLFSKFYRVDNSDHRKIGGTGLGLAICKEIVSSHQGSIGVKSKEGIGSTFYFTLPLFKKDDKNL